MTGAIDSKAPTTAPPEEVRSQDQIVWLVQTQMVGLSVHEREVSPLQRVPFAIVDRYGCESYDQSRTAL